MGELRSQIELHLLMVEEVLSGTDIFIRRLEKRVSRIEEGLGFEPEGYPANASFSAFSLSDYGEILR